MSKAITKYNALKGVTSRKDLVKIIDLSKSENQIHVENKLTDLLDQYPKQTEFDIEVTQPLEALNTIIANALNGAKHKGLAKKALDSCGRLKPGFKFSNGKIKQVAKTANNLKAALLKAKADLGLSISDYSQITKCGLTGAYLADGHAILTQDEIDLYSNDDDTEGLNAAAKDVEAMVNKLVLDKINTGEKLPPWKQTWANKSNILAQNFVTKKEYSGSNSVILNILLGSIQPTPYYLTPNQIKGLGGSIAKGAKSVPLVYYNFIYKLKDFTDNPGKESALLGKVGGYVIKRKNKKPFTVNRSNYANLVLTEKDVKYLKLDRSEYLSVGFLKYYRVFNVADTTGIKYDVPSKENKSKAQTILSAENIVKSYLDKPKIVGHPDEASYAPATDILKIPNISVFDTPEEYYSTLFHELIHSTIHKDRLDRGAKYEGKEQKAVYAFEELIAELGASYLCGLAGILESTHINQASYLKGWHEKLVKLSNENSNFFVFATQQAQKAVDYIIKDYDENKVPEDPKDKTPSKKNLIIEFKKLLNENLKVEEFEPTKKSFKPGDKYSSDFDYKGMFLEGLKITEKTSKAILLKLHESFEDVNYITESKILSKLIDLTTDKLDPKEKAKAKARAKAQILKLKLKTKTQL